MSNENLVENIHRVYTENSQKLYTLNCLKRFNYSRIKIDQALLRSNIAHHPDHEKELIKLLQKLKEEQSFLNQNMPKVKPRAKSEKKLQIEIPKDSDDSISSEEETPAQQRAREQTQIWHQYDFLLAKQVRRKKDDDIDLNDCLDNVQKTIAFVSKQLAEQSRREVQAQQMFTEKVKKGSNSQNVDLFKNQNHLTQINRLKMKIEDLEGQLQRIFAKQQSIYEGPNFRILLEPKTPTLLITSREIMDAKRALNDKLNDLFNNNHMKEPPLSDRLNRISLMKEKLLNQENDLKGLVVQSKPLELEQTARKMTSKIDALQRCMSNDKSAKRKRSQSKSRMRDESFQLITERSFMESDR